MEGRGLAGQVVSWCCLVVTVADVLEKSVIAARRGRAWILGHYSHQRQRPATLGVSCTVLYHLDFSAGTGSTFHSQSMPCHRSDDGGWQFLLQPNAW